MAQSKIKNYWIASQLFYPNETSTAFVMTKIAEQMLNSGSVNVICGSSFYQSEALNSAKNIDPRIVIHRIKTEINKNNLFLRFLGSIILSFRISLKILFNVTKTDTLILVTNPPVLILFASVVKRLKKFKMYVLVHDVFPENLSVTGAIKDTSLVYKILVKMFNTAYGNATHLITCGSDMKQIFQKKTKNVPITVITNWADHLEVFEKSEYNISSYYNMDLRDKIVLQFAGNIGRLQGLDRFIELFANLSTKKLFLVIIGDGAFKQKLINVKLKYGLANILFLDSKPRSEQNDFLNACDIGLVTLSEKMYGLGVPSKVYNVFSAAKPVLYIGDNGSEIYNYIKQHDIGWAFTWDDTSAIGTFLTSLDPLKKPLIKKKGKAARQIIVERFTRSYILDQYSKIFNC